MIKLILIVLYLITNVNQAKAFFEKRYQYRQQDDNRPPFYDQYASNGMFYIGGGFGWGKAKINDMRSVGFSESLNKSLYNSEYNYEQSQVTDGSTLGTLSANSFSNKFGSYSMGSMVIGYAPKSGLFSATRHELEFSKSSHSASLKHISDTNMFCGDLTNCSSTSGYTSLQYTISQKSIMYNLYIQPNMKQNLNWFIGGGIGIVYTSAALTGNLFSSTTTVTVQTPEIVTQNGSTSYTIPSSTTTNTYSATDSLPASADYKTWSNSTPITNSDGSVQYTNTSSTGATTTVDVGIPSVTTDQSVGSFKNGVSSMYSIFVGATYDLTDSVVMQGKLRYSIVNKANKNYINHNYEGQGKMMTVIALEVDILLGW